jgi:hypothetical protein
MAVAFPDSVSVSEIGFSEGRESSVGREEK